MKTKPEFNCHDNCYKIYKEDKEDENVREPFWEIQPDHLTDKERGVLGLRLQGYTYEQIGSRMDFTKSWASELLSSAIKKIKEANAKT